MQLTGRKSLGWAAKAAVGTTLALVALACTPYSNYRVVQKTPNASGEVALEGEQNAARQKAEAFMKTECAGSGGYDIVDEHEATTGSSQKSNADTQNRLSLFNGPTKNTQTTTETRDTHEMRLRYKCKGAADAPPSEKASTPAPKSSEIKEIVVRF